MEIIGVLFVVAGLIYAGYRIIVRALEATAEGRRYITSSSKEQIYAAFQESVGRMGWRMVQQGDEDAPSVATSKAVNPVEVLCDVRMDSQFGGANSVLLAVAPSTIGNIGKGSAWGGMIGAYLEARMIRYRLDRFENKLRSFDPQLRTGKPKGHPRQGRSADS